MQRFDDNKEYEFSPECTNLGLQPRYNYDVATIEPFMDEARKQHNKERSGRGLTVFSFDKNRKTKVDGNHNDDDDEDNK